MNIGLLLRYYRKLQNLSQSDLAERADINEKYYSKIERDENNPTYSVVNKIVNALEMKMTQLSIATDGYCNFDYIFFPIEMENGVFIKEIPPRFVAEVYYKNKIEQVYVASSVKLTNLISLENRKVNLQRIEGDSKFVHSLFSLDHNSVKIILNLNIINKIFYELYCLGTLSGYHWYGAGKQEITCDDYKADYFFEQEKIIVENKTIISEEESCDYPVEKAQRYEEQFRKIEKLIKRDYTVRMNFFILSPWTNKIKFKDDFFRKLKKLKNEGMKVFFYYLCYEKEILKVTRAKLVLKDNYYDIVFYKD